MILAVSILLCGVSSAQLGSPDPKAPFADAIERRLAETDLHMLPAKLRERRIRNFSDPEIFKQMNEDFLRIQAARAKMVKVFAEGSSMPPDELQSTGREIRRRATRLRSLLALSEDYKDVSVPKAVPLTVTSLNARAYQLCLEISRFTGNPMFVSKGIITVKNAKEAGETLDLLIGLASVLEKESRSLSEK